MYLSYTKCHYQHTLYSNTTGRDGRDGIQGPPGLTGTPGRDGTMVKMAIKETKENLDHKDLQDQEMEVWSLLDGDVPPVLLPMIQNYSTKGMLLGVLMIIMEVELTTFVYLMSLSFYSKHLAFLNISLISMEQNIKLRAMTRGL